MILYVELFSFFFLELRGRNAILQELLKNFKNERPTYGIIAAIIKKHDVLAKTVSNIWKLARHCYRGETANVEAKICDMQYNATYDG